MSIVSIIQPSFLPWRGYFRFIKKSHFFIFYDDVQFDKRGWRNRNQIKTTDGLIWMTVPVLTKGKYYQKICDTKIDYETSWQKKMLTSISQSYSKTPHYSDYFPWLEARLYQKWETISELDIQLTKDISSFFKFNCQFRNSSEFSVPESCGRVERLLYLCSKVGANHYLSGPSAKKYIDSDNKFIGSGVQLEYMDYSLPDYEQNHMPFTSSVSIIDLLFNCGANSAYI